MPEKKTYMQLLDEWTEENVLYPIGSEWMAELEDAGRGELMPEFKARLQRVEAEVKKAIREKTWESYRNGQAAGPKQANSGERPAKTGYRRPFRKSP